MSRPEPERQRGLIHYRDEIHRVEMVLVFRDDEGRCNWRVEAPDQPFDMWIVGDPAVTDPEPVR